MERILLISVEKLKQLTDINENIEDKILETNIYDAQKLQVETILGTKLYNYYTTNYENIQEPFLSLYNNYIFDAILNWSKYYSLNSLFFKLSNTGIINKNNEYSTNVDLTSYKYLITQQETRAKYYSKRLEDYLCANSSVFSEYTSNDSWNKQMIDKTTYQTGTMVFGNKSKKYSKKDERYY